MLLTKPASDSHTKCCQETCFPIHTSDVLNKIAFRFAQQMLLTKWGLRFAHQVFLTDWDSDSYTKTLFERTCEGVDTDLAEAKTIRFLSKETRGCR